MGLIQKYVQILYTYLCAALGICTVFQYDQYVPGYISKRHLSAFLVWKGQTQITGGKRKVLISLLPLGCAALGM